MVVVAGELAVMAALEMAELLTLRQTMDLVLTQRLIQVVAAVLVLIWVASVQPAAMAVRAL